MLRCEGQTYDSPGIIRHARVSRLMVNFGAPELFPATTMLKIRF